MVYHRIGCYYQLSQAERAEIDRLLISIKQNIQQTQVEEAKSSVLHAPETPYFSSQPAQFQKWDSGEDEKEEEIRIDDPITGKHYSIPVKRKLTFAEKVDQILDERGLKRPEVYRRAGMDRTLFSKILSNRNYSPSKDTAISVSFGLKLSLEEADDLLKRAGYALSHSVARDLVIECCFMEGIYDVVKVNIILEKLGHLPLNKIAYK